MSTALVPMTPAELQDLHRLETEFFDGIKQESAGRYKARHAIHQIKNRELYRASHGSWEAYRRDVLKRTKQRVDQILEWAQIEESVSKALDSTVEMTDRQARTLADVPEDKRPEVWAASAKATGGNPQPEQIRRAEELLDELPDTDDKEEQVVERIKTETQKRRTQANRETEEDAIKRAIKYVKGWRKRRDRLPTTLQEQLDAVIDVEGALEILESARAG